MRYVVDSWIEYVAVRKGVARRETKVSGHYIAYKFIEGTLYHFDDTIVNSTQMLSEYETNLIFYWRADIPPYAWDIDFGFITYRMPELYGHKPYSLRGTLATSNDLKEGTGDNQPVFPEAIAITMTSEADSLHKDKDELNVNNEIMDKNNTPQTESDTKACDDQVLESTNPHTGNIPQHQNNMDSANDKGVTDGNVEKDNIGQTINKGDIDNETLENLVENPNINILGVATIEENKTDKSSKLSSTISSEVVLSEFDETVEYPSQKGSESSSSGSSPHTDEDDEKEGESSQSSAIAKNKPDLSLKPKLITLSTLVSTPRKRMHRKPRHMYAKTHLQATQEG